MSHSSTARTREDVQSEGDEMVHHRWLLLMARQPCKSQHCSLFSWLAVLPTRHAHLAKVGRLVALLAQHVTQRAQLGLVLFTILQGAQGFLHHEVEYAEAWTDARF